MRGHYSNVCLVPRIVDFDENSVTLRWAKPVNDGGRPISHYVIQKKGSVISETQNNYESFPKF